MIGSPKILFVILLLVFSSQIFAVKKSTDINAKHPSSQGEGSEGDRKDESDDKDTSDSLGDVRKSEERDNADREPEGDSTNPCRTIALYQGGRSCGLESRNGESSLRYAMASGIQIDFADFPIPGLTRFSLNTLALPNRIEANMRHETSMGIVSTKKTQGDRLDLIFQFQQAIASLGFQPVLMENEPTEIGWLNSILEQLLAYWVPDASSSVDESPEPLPSSAAAIADQLPLLFQNLGIVDVGEIEHVVINAADASSPFSIFSSIPEFTESVNEAMGSDSTWVISWLSHEITASVQINFSKVFISQSTNTLYLLNPLLGTQLFSRSILSSQLNVILSSIQLLQGINEFVMIQIKPSEINGIEDENDPMNQLD